MRPRAKCRVDGRLVFNAIYRVLNAARSGYLIEALRHKK